MYKLPLISLAVLGAAPLVLARNCTPGLDYCGHTLTGIVPRSPKPCTLLASPRLMATSETVDSTASVDQRESLHSSNIAITTVLTTVRDRVITATGTD
ncbi:hypothetical protein E4U55_003772 [Claviceps digitariae]|nr:hypothetical protein E4U55_003772 [Claviceps digitariae]